MHKIHQNKSIDMSLFHRIDMNLYPLFIAIFEHKSISKSAQILAISQSAASHALQRLRSQLNDDLFVRTGTKMLATPFSEQIYPHVKTALLSIQNINHQKIEFEPQAIQSLKIAIHDEIEPIIFPKLVSHFQRFNPDISFLSVKLDRKNIVADLASQQIDFVIDLEQKTEDKIEFLSLLQDHFVVCSQHTEMDLHRYLSSPHIGVSSRRTGVLIEDLLLKQKHLSRQIFLRCQHYATALHILMEQPNAILTLPNSILVNMSFSSQLNIFPVPISLPEMNMGIFWHQDLNENLRHQFFKNEIKSIFA